MSAGPALALAQPAAVGVNWIQAQALRAARGETDPAALRDEIRRLLGQPAGHA